MKFSIITAVKNNETFIADALQSVMEQDYPNIEHIIIDGGSTDNTISIIRDTLANMTSEQWMLAEDYSIIKSNPGKEFLLFSGKDSGIYNAINKGIKAATGDTIGLLHSDDTYYDNGVISKAAKIFSERNSECVYSDLLYVGKNETNKIFRKWEAGDFILKKLREGWMPPHPTLFLKKSVFDQYGYYDESFSIAADYEFILRIFSKKEFNAVYMPGFSYKMRTGGISNRNPLKILTKSYEDYKALKLHNFENPLLTLLKKNFTKLPQLLKGAGTR